MTSSPDPPSGHSTAYPSRLHGLAEWRSYRRAPLVGRWSPDSARAAWWAWTSLRRARADLRATGLAASVPPPPDVPAGARRGVEFVLRRTEPTCLERCVVLQRWLAANSVPCEVVIGVAAGTGSVRAHAWLDIEAADATAREYSELHRIPPP